MKVAVCKQTRQITKDEIYKEVELLIDKGALMFYFFDDSEFDLAVARAVRNFKRSKSLELYTILYITNRQKSYNKNDFDLWAQFSPNTNISETVEKMINNADFVYRKKTCDF